MLRPDGHAFVPEAVEGLGGEVNVVVVPQLDVEFHVSLEAGVGEIRRAGDHRAVAVRVFGLLAEDVDLGVDRLGRMDADFNLPGCHVVHQADHAGFHRLTVSRGLNIGGQCGKKLGAGSGRIGAELEAFVPSFLHEPVDVDADENADLARLLNEGAHPEIPRRTKVADQNVEKVDPLVQKHALDLVD